jgi:hypothetical protein
MYEEKRNKMKRKDAEINDMEQESKKKARGVKIRYGRLKKRS